MPKKLSLDQNELELIEHSIIQMEEEHGMDRNAALADMRYDFIEKVCGATVIKPQESNGASAECKNRQRADE